MKNAIILHGMPSAEEYLDMDFPSPSNAHWIPWLQQKFLRDGILCQTPEMPRPYDPDYREWADTFEQFSIGANTTIVGHSTGAGFILKWLSLHTDAKLERLVLVAPWLDPHRVKGDLLACDFTNELQSRVPDIQIFHSPSDPVPGIAESVDRIVNILPRATLHILPDKGHFCFDDLGGPAFPELWEACRSRGV